MSLSKLDLRSSTALRYVAYCLDYSVNWNVTSKFYHTVAYITYPLFSLVVVGLWGGGGGGLTPVSFHCHDWRDVTLTIKNRFVVTPAEIEPLTFCVWVRSDLDVLSERQENQLINQLSRRQPPFLHFRVNLKWIWMGLNVWWMCLVYYRRLTISQKFSLKIPINKIYPFETRLYGVQPILISW